MIIDGKKYACQTCIKGHRSSGCTHTDRPLHEVKPKGRPITQCQHCRDLRKTRQVHVKCSCGGGDEQPQEPKRKKPRNASPEPPVFPNGLTSEQTGTIVYKPQRKQQSKPQRQKQPTKDCGCDLTGECHCSTPSVKEESVSPPPEPPAPTTDDPHGLLNSLVRAAAHAGLVSQPTQMVASTSHVSNPTFTPRLGMSRDTMRQPHSPIPRTGGSCCNPPPASERPIMSDMIDHPPEHHHHLHHHHHAPSSSSTNPFDLANAVLSCSCGEGCGCPGCIEHRGMDALFSPEYCPTACSSCFSCISAAVPGSAPSIPHLSEWLESAAAALPEPPAHRSKRNPFELDGTNVTVYAPSVWHNEDAARAAGLVKVPKMCCSGKCKCPAGTCKCLEDCCGCCDGCACVEHETMPHYTGYQGSIRCNYETSGVRGSCCKNEEASESASSPSMSSALTPHARSPTATTADAISSISSLSRSLSRQREMSSAATSPIGQPRSPTRQPYHTPPSGAFAFGQVDPQSTYAGGIAPAV